MTIQEVANRYYGLACKGKWIGIIEELHDANVICQEPAQAALKGMQVPLMTKGREAVNAKNMANRKMIETLHSEYCSEPIVGGNFFSVALKRDVTYKGKPRMIFEEIGVFQVTEGKIILEQFFY
jgi:hypothetical protein